MDDLKERLERLEGELAVEEAKESLRLNRDRVLFWLERMSRATDEQIIALFVSRVIVAEDGGRHVILIVDEEEPPDGLPEGVEVRSDSNQPDHEMAGQRLKPLTFFLIRTI